MENEKIISRQEAKNLGYKFYYTGNPCKNGHFSKRRISNCFCVECEVEKNKLSTEYKKQHYKKNKEKYLKNAKSNYLLNLDKKRKYASDYQKKNLDRIIYLRKQRMCSDILYSIKERIRCLIKISISNMNYTKKSKTCQILGCSFEEFKRHIERQFKKGMAWENRSLWHIDHVIPVSSAKTEEEIILLNHFTNLRPIWAAENFSKGNKMEYLI
jgi:predicted transcriptional regulator/Uri superfamily endonuclease